MINRVWTKSIPRETMIINTDCMKMKQRRQYQSTYIQSFCSNSANLIIVSVSITIYALRSSSSRSSLRLSELNSTRNSSALKICHRRSCRCLGSAVSFVTDKSGCRFDANCSNAPSRGLDWPLGKSVDWIAGRKG